MSTIDRQRLKKLLSERRLSIRKGWVRCKHGIVLKRGAKVVGTCFECPPPMVAVPKTVCASGIMVGKETYFDMSLSEYQDRGVV